MTLSAGDRIERYTIVRLLGRGGMGEVYEAEDPKLQRHVALKLLRSDANVAIASRQRLLREARAVAALSHPNVLAVFDVGEVSDVEGPASVTYLAMELVSGSTLRARMSGGHVPLALRLSWLKDTASALAAAHRAGLVHRDIKPENVMIRDDGVVKVLDFGIARSVGAPSVGLVDQGRQAPTGMSATLNLREAGTTRTEAGVILGTPHYMAPEQLRGEPLDGRADQFSWGVMAYEVLTGVSPWTTGATPLVLISQILSRDPAPPALVARGIPEALSRLVLKAMAKQPRDRFPTMDDLLVALSRAMDRSPSLDSRPAHVEHTRWLPPALTFAVLGLVALVSFQVVRARSSSSAVTQAAIAPPLTDSCDSSRECAVGHAEQAWHCNSVRHQCVPLTSADCKPFVQASALANPETVWIGAMYPTTGPEAEAFAIEANALKMARDEFADALSPNAASSGARRARPIGLLLCDETADPLRAANHLARDVEVPAVLGFRDFMSASSMISGPFLNGGILSMITISQVPELVRLPEPVGEPRLVWRATLDSADTVPPSAALFARLLAQSSSGGARPNGRTHVAVLRGHRRGELADELFRSIRFNGESALENGDDFRQYVLDESGDAGLDEAIDSLLRFRPSAIFGLSPLFFQSALGPFEAQWLQRTRPTYFIQSGDFASTIESFAGNDPRRRHRFYGVTNVSTRMTNAQLVLRYNTLYPDARVIRTIAPQPSYDGMYMLAYAILSLGDQPITGPAISLAFDRLLPPGHPIDVGPEDITTAFALLRSGQNIDLNGAIGNLDFDRATGEAPIDYAIVCLNVDDRGFASGSVESGLVYDAKAKKLTGTMHCP